MPSPTVHVCLPSLTHSSKTPAHCSGDDAVLMGACASILVIGAEFESRDFKSEIRVFLVLTDEGVDTVQVSAWLGE
jgi:hypothetical protein